jgi:hypothetical protein
VLLPTLLVEYFHQKQWKPQGIDFKLVWTSLPLVGSLEYLNINNQVTGGFFTFMEIERTHWHNSIDPLRGLAQAGQYAVTGIFPENITIGIAPIVFAVIGLLMVVAGYKLRLRPSYNVYLLFTWMLSVSTGWWISVPRYIMAMFPMFIILGLLARKRIINYTLIIGFTAMLCFFTVLFSMGRWAF